MIAWMERPRLDHQEEIRNPWFSKIYTVHMWRSEDKLRCSSGFFQLFLVHDFTQKAGLASQWALKLCLHLPPTHCWDNKGFFTQFLGIQTQVIMLAKQKLY